MDTSKRTVNKTEERGEVSTYNVNEMGTILQDVLAENNPGSIKECKHIAENIARDVIQSIRDSGDRTITLDTQYVESLLREAESDSCTEKRRVEIYKDVRSFCKEIRQDEAQTQQNILNAERMVMFALIVIAIAGFYMISPVKISPNTAKKIISVASKV